MTENIEQSLDQAIHDFTDALTRVGYLSAAMRMSTGEVSALKLSVTNPDLSQLDERKADIKLALRELAGHTLVAACDIYEAALLGKAPRTDFIA
jgi:hypothetical protein